MGKRDIFLGAIVFAIGCAIYSDVSAQDYGARLGERRGGKVTFQPKGPGVLFGALDPAVKKWYVPQELYQEYQWRQWEYSNYARTNYGRYVDIALQGDYLYDIYGNYTTRGWLIYTWKQSHPLSNGSSLFRDQRFGSWFNNVVIASDSKGQYHTSVLLGTAIRTTLTPMTFSKPSFDGIQLDFLSDKYAATVLTSRVSAPGSSPEISSDQNDVTILLGGRGTIQIGDFVRIGGTYVNTHQSQSIAESVISGNPLRGVLSGPQNSQNVSVITIRLADDSPEDREGGAAFFSERIIITTRDGDVMDSEGLGLSSETGWPEQRGGFRKEGFFTADGQEQIFLIYDFNADQYRATGGPAPADIEKVTFELLLGNDYRVDLNSNAQTDRFGKPVFLSDSVPERSIRASGNVKDNSNQKIVRIDYGLPTGSEIIGMTLEVTDAWGFDLYSEWDLSRRYMQYPNLSIELGDHHYFSTTSDAWMINISKKSYPWFGFGEFFSMDPEYSTSNYVGAIIVGRGGSGTFGQFDYADVEQSVFELVEDNDDQDRFPDWRRQLGTFDREVFPGWDENNDFISDFNQNDNKFSPNFIPDFEEPFLRYDADRPEFLFGIDMNNNGWIDRFENDEDPDYLYNWTLAKID